MMYTTHEEVRNSVSCNGMHMMGGEGRGGG